MCHAPAVLDQTNFFTVLNVSFGKLIGRDGVVAAVAAVADVAAATKPFIF